MSLCVIKLQLSVQFIEQPFGSRRMLEENPVCSVFNYLEVSVIFHNNVPIGAYYTDSLDFLMQNHLILNFNIILPLQLSAPFIECEEQPSVSREVLEMSTFLIGSILLCISSILQFLIFSKRRSVTFCQGVFFCLASLYEGRRELLNSLDPTNCRPGSTFIVF